MKKLIPSVLICACLSACVSVPNGPRVAVMPAPGKPFEVFQQEDFTCRQFAQSSVGTTADDAAIKNAVGSAAVGAGVGALVGALTNGSSGAGAGAAIGAVGGTLIGSSNGNFASRDTQTRYDIAYQQCMYAKGNQIPSTGVRRVYVPVTAVGSAPYSPPPSGMPPPPPPSYGATPPPPPPR